MNTQTQKMLAKILGIALISSIALGWMAHTWGSDIQFAANLWDAIFPRLQVMLVIAVLIERSVEVYLFSTGQNGPDRFSKGTTDPINHNPTTVVAAVTALALGLLVALVGVRVLDVLLVSPLVGIHGWIWAGVDIVISAGLMAGGSALVHEVMELLRGTINSGSRVLKKDKAEVQNIAQTSSSEYQVIVERKSSSQGTLKFNEKGVAIESDCWWDPNVKIASGIYNDCSATRMTNKLDSVTGQKRPAIFLPTATAPDTGKNSIFIHEGKDPSWSDGCIVLPRDEMMRMWNVIEKNEKNVTIQVVDA